MAQLEAKYGKGISSRSALFSPPFRFYMGGNLLASVGEWMDMVTLNWAVLQMTNSPLHLAFVNACRLIPIFLLSVPAGVLADRYDRRKLLMLLQTGVLLLTLCLALFVQQGVSFWLFVAVVTCRSVLMAMDPPIRNSMIPNLVPPAAIASSIAMNTAIANLSRIVGPAVAGGLLLFFRPEQIFYIAAGGYALEVCALYIIRLKTQEGGETKRSQRGVKAELGEALRFIKKHSPVQSLLLLVVVPMVFGFPYTSMMPVFARDLLSLGPDGFGALLSVSAAGAFAGSLLLSALNQQKGAGRRLVWSLLGFGVTLGLFMLARSFVVAAVLMFWVGFTSQTYRTMSRITLQMQVPDHLRGRIMSIALMDRGFIPLGSLLIGAIADLAGTLPAGLVMGAGCVGITLLVLLLRRGIWAI